MTDRVATLMGKVIFILFMPLVTTLIGVVTGYFVGLFFTDTISGVFEQISGKHFEVWQIGAFFGFIGGFFQSRLIQKQGM